MQNHNSIRLMTSNVLGNWNAGFIENRDDKMAEIYLDVCPDVIALQEFSKRYRTQESNLLTLIAPVYKEVETPAANRNHNNSTPLVYRADRFQVLDHGYHFFEDGICDNSKSITWAVFQERNNGKRFIYASAHFIHTSEEARMIDGDQTKLLCDALTDFYNCPLLIGGDYNCGKKSDAYKHLISLGFIDIYDRVPGVSKVKSYHPYPVWDDVKKQYVPSPEPADGDYTDSIDHIFYYGKYELIPQINAYEMVTDDRAWIASDHYPVFADITLRD